MASPLEQHPGPVPLEVPARAWMDLRDEGLALPKVRKMAVAAHSSFACSCLLAAIPLSRMALAPPSPRGNAFHLFHVTPTLAVMSSPASQSHGHTLADRCVCFEILWQIDGKPNFSQTAEVIWDLLVSNDKSSCHQCPDTEKWEIVAHRCLTTFNDLLTTSINLFSETLWKYPTVYNPQGNASRLFHVTLT